jgi:hypothetical protein
VNEIAWQALLILLMAVVVIQGIVLAGVLRQLGGVMLHVGSPRHGDVGEGPERGVVVDLDELDVGRPSILVFVSPRCQLCKPIADALPIVDRAFPEAQLLALVVNGSKSEREAYLSSLKVPALSDADSLFSSWSVPGTPFAVGLSARNRVVTSGIVNNLPQLEALVEDMSRSLHHESDAHAELPLATVSTDRSD